jgi:GNAT superfamily N-acetyltransferase
MTKAYVAALETAVADDAGDGALFVAEADGRVVGFVACFAGQGMLESDSREVTVHDLVVAGAARRSIGRLLLAAAHRFAADRGIRRMIVSEPAAKVLAAAAYQGLGLRPLSLVLKVDGEPEAAAAP